MGAYIIMIMILGFSGAAGAQDLGTSQEIPTKNTPIVTYEPPAVPSQGGDTIEDATVIPSLPYSITGTTSGFVNDYDEGCPYSGSLSPDVVYSFTPAFDVQVDVDLCGSGYDTKTYIYESEGFNLVACNDDFYFDEPCGMYRSRIERAPLFEGNTYLSSSMVTVVIPAIMCSTFSGSIRAMCTAQTTPCPRGSLRCMTVT